MSLWLVTAYFPAHIAAGNTSHLKRIPPNNFDSHHKIDGTNSVGDHTANGFVECGFDKVTLHLFSSFAQTAFLLDFRTSQKHKENFNSLKIDGFFFMGFETLRSSF